jgi:hypothetical protein
LVEHRIEATSAGRLNPYWLNTGLKRPLRVASILIG